ncbi:MAG: bifunctional helix-turn-helix transcriptional regulator/GNAT family N-acetyltransferase [Candidatus Zixiibacteriota bacterium]
MDLIKELGTLALASRLKRLSESMMKGVSRLYEEQNVEFHPRWFPVVYLLKQEGPMAITAIADALGMTHPAINQTAGQLSRHGLISSRRDRKDERRRILALNKKGRETIRKLEPLWVIIERCGRDLVTECGPDFLQIIEKIEGELVVKDMYERVNECLLWQRPPEVEINGYQPSLKSHFKKLNYEWLNKYFRVEDHDREILNHPERFIIKNGGRIFFVRVNGEIVGTAALLKTDDRTYELAKMAVTEKWQGKGIGKKLVREVIDQARKLGARRVILATSPELERAVRLYRGMGFVETQPDRNQDHGYQRCTIFMEMILDKLK